MRCPKCGNDVSKDDYVCVYCEARLREERIESIKLFRRIDEKWTKPLSKFRRMLLVIANPSRAFWDITHYREKVGGGLVYLVWCLSFGLIGSSIYAHVDLSPTVGTGSVYAGLIAFGINFLQSMSMFMLFFLFGLIYYGLFIWLGNKLFKWGANYSINLSDQLKLRYGEGKTEDEVEEDTEKTRAQLEAEGEYVMELPEYLTSQESKTGSIMRYAYIPYILSLLISALVLLIALPTVGPSNLEPLWESRIWGIIDWIQVIFLIGWVPITMSIALRDIANASTMKVYISCLTVSIIIAFFVYFLRPTLMMQYIT
ncbi:MAG: hypothetical protein GF364_08395 [Candidatus Lokiarchaeota archaeon]|nr:hypothetical protein [Candidatus Lokiarchaeota archaeon]